jgi:hypothetical protein
MSLVLDCSVTVSWFFAVEHTEASMSVLDTVTERDSVALAHRGRQRADGCPSA